MNTPTTSYADRLIDTICDCLSRCQAGEDALDCAREYIARIRADATWTEPDADRVERAVMRKLRPIEALEFMAASVVSHREPRMRATEIKPALDQGAWPASLT